MKKHAYAFLIPLIAAGAALPATAFAMPMISADGSAQVGIAATATTAAGIVYHGAMQGADNAAGVHLDSATDADAQISAGASATGTAMAQEHASATGTAHASDQSALAANAAGVTITMPLQVETQDDLKVYTHNLPVENHAVVAADADADGSVTVSYAHPAKLFGMIPVTIVSHTTIAAGDGGAVTVSTSLPWWHVLAVSGDFASLNGTLSTSPALSADVAANASASQKAQAIAIVAEALQAQEQAQMNLQATGSVNVQ